MVKNKGFLPTGAKEVAMQREQIKSIVYSLLAPCTEPDLDSGVPFRANVIIANPPAYGIFFPSFSSPYVLPHLGEVNFILFF
jgi:sterol 3beta-glucosyltransferase